MPLRLENPAVELLAQEVADLTGETPAEAVQTALEERKARLRPTEKPNRSLDEILATFDRLIWSKLDPELLGKGISQSEQDEILGYGPEGY